MFRILVTALTLSGLGLAQTQDPLATLRKQHPRLIALDSDIDRTRELIQHDPGARQLYERLVADAKKIEESPTVEYKLKGPRLLDQSRRAVDRIYTLGLLYRLDHKRQYLDRAVKEMRAAANFPDWHPPHFLDTAEMTHAMAIGYDWFYNDLKPEDRVWIRQSIIDKGLNAALPLYQAQKGWTVNRFNWNQVCNGGISIGALAIAEDDPERSGTVLKYALKSIPLPMAQYSPDGGWKEGPGYWHYATRYNVYFLAALNSALGTDFGLSATKGFDQAGRFRIYSSGPAGSFNYADAHEGVGGAAELFWLAKRYSQPSYAWAEQQYLQDGGHGDALDLLWYQPKGPGPKEAGWPLGAFFESVQVGFLRSSWDSDAIFVGVKGGDNKAGHSHLDLGSFVLDAGGERWATDLGGDDYNLPVGYFGANRWTVYRTRTESHNTVLINSENQDPKGEAKVIAQRFQPDAAFVRIDLSGAYPKLVNHFERGIGIQDRKYVIVQDEIRADKPVDALWGMVTHAAVSPAGAKAELQIEGQALSAVILSPAGAKFDVVATQPPAPQNQNKGTRKLVVRLPEKVTDLRLAVALMPHKAGETAPRLTWKDRPLAKW